ncbi:hypothetical protein [Nocardia terpenica]|uniref:Uncharacterized protein n=1 Tax=Nocardia terpenica TaxID=455432 RepID=A0A6G9Z6I2_9NOCA|nr:hypothetical protein [Nocardia terpenica]QIS20613.1 hypothetical protein F6W96_22250 [Nocardia terpenica]
MTARAEAELGGRGPAPTSPRATRGPWHADTGVPWPLIAAHLGHPDIRPALARHGHVLPERDRA